MALFKLQPPTPQHTPDDVITLIRDRFRVVEQSLEDQDKKLEQIHAETRATNGRVTKIEKRHERKQTVIRWIFRGLSAVVVAAAGGAAGVVLH